MIPGINTALSGLTASSRRLAVSADNIANMQSTLSRRDGVTVSEPYAPQQVVQTSLSTGGVRADLQPVDPASVPVYDPSNPASDAGGMVQYPNVNLEEEIANQIVAKYDYMGNLKTLKTADEMMKSLLNIVS